MPLFFFLAGLLALSLVVLWVRSKFNLWSAVSVWLLICVAGSAWVWMFLDDDATVRLVLSAQIFVFLGLAVLPAALLPKSIPTLPKLSTSIVAPGIVTYFAFYILIWTCMAVAGFAEQMECAP